jgi:trimethylamine:corrinoid methyltransferase-like protein
VNARRSASGRRRTQRQAPPAEARLDLVKRAREALPTLSTDSLYRIHDLLERVLEEPELDPRAFDELERALEPPAR